MPFGFDRKIELNIEEHHPLYTTHIDKWLKPAPYFFLGVLDLLRVKTKNNWKKHVLLLSLCEAIRYSLTDALKKAVHERRPNPFSKHVSFPSGDTATCVAGAEILRQELKSSHPVLAYSGYAAAAITAALRLYNKRHWLTDVVAGAAVGFLSAQAAYLIVKKFRKKKFSKNTKPSSVQETFRQKAGAETPFFQSAE